MFTKVLKWLVVVIGSGLLGGWSAHAVGGGVAGLVLACLIGGVMGYVASPWLFQD